MGESSLSKKSGNDTKIYGQVLSKEAGAQRNEWWH